MIIIGHPWIDANCFCKVFTKEDIEKVPTNAVVLLEPLVDSHALASYCKEESIPFALPANNLKEALFANALGASYMVCEEDDALIIQPIAQEYLFDTKILALIHDEKEIAKLARSGVDGVIFPEAIY
jgi:hypothetical protein